MRDFVQREIVIQGPVDRVFAALIDPSTFPSWGPEAIEGDVAPGERPVLDFGPAGGGKVRVYVVAVEPPRRFAYRWAQGATDPAVLVGDPLAVPNTLVEFFVDEVEGGTRVRVVESGISVLPGMEAAPDDAVENMGKGSTKVSPKRAFHLRTISRVSSRCCRWSSPTGTRWAP